MKIQWKSMPSPGKGKGKAKKNSARARTVARKEKKVTQAKDDRFWMFGHFCPPWFAPQFPMVSSTNVEAVAANNVALQHYGQKVIYEHMMTNSGRHLT